MVSLLQKNKNKLYIYIYYGSGARELVSPVCGIFVVDKVHYGQHLLSFRTPSCKQWDGSSCAQILILFFFILDYTLIAIDDR